MLSIVILYWAFEKQLLIIYKSNPEEMLWI